MKPQLSGNWSFCFNKVVVGDIRYDIDILEADIGCIDIFLYYDIACSNIKIIV